MKNEAVIKRRVKLTTTVTGMTEPCVYVRTIFPRYMESPRPKDLFFRSNASPQIEHFPSRKRIVFLKAKIHYPSIHYYSQPIADTFLHKTSLNDCNIDNIWRNPYQITKRNYVLVDQLNIHDHQCVRANSNFATGSKQM